MLMYTRTCVLILWGLILLAVSEFQAFATYNPQTGRWLNRDPLREVGSHPWWLRNGASTRRVDLVVNSDGSLTMLPPVYECDKPDEALGDDSGFNPYWLLGNHALLDIDALGTGWKCACSIKPGFITASPPVGKCSYAQYISTLPGVHTQDSKPFNGYCGHKWSSSTCSCYIVSQCVFKIQYTCSRYQLGSSWIYYWDAKPQNVKGICLP